MENNLSFEEFQHAVRDQIRDYLPEDYGEVDVKLQSVLKNNGKTLHAVIISDSKNQVAPTIYLESHYENYKQGQDMDIVLSNISKLYMENAGPHEDFGNIQENFMNPDWVKENVVMALVNGEKNKELLADCPHRFKEDLAIIYKVYLGSRDGGMGSITIHNCHMKGWEVLTENDLYTHAMENSNRLMPAKVASLGSVLGGLMGEDAAGEIIDGTPEMFVITNKQSTNGAAAIIYSDALEQASENFGGQNLFILPSSIHETLAIPEVPGTEQDMVQMVREVNANEVAVEEQLSDHVYRYDAKTKTLSLADTSVAELKKSGELAMVSENTQEYEAPKPAHRSHHHM